MYLLTCLIKIGSLTFDFVNNIEIDAALNERTDTCTITLAKKVYARNAEGWDLKPITEVIKRGDRVEVYLGYDGDLKLEFKGYVRQVLPNVPVKIECEDEMFILKTKPVSGKVFQGGKISDVIKHIAPGYKTMILDSNLGGSFTIANDEPTALKVLEKIEEVYGLKSTFRLVNGEPVLIVGRAYSGEDMIGVEPVRYVLNKNVIENSLEFVSKDDLQIKIDATSLQSNGKKLKSSFKGDKEGDTKSFSIPGLSQQQLDTEAKRLYTESKRDRFDGDFTTFGIPFLQKGMLVNIKGAEFELSETTNYADAVSVSFGVGGFRRTITLGPKL